MNNRRAHPRAQHAIGMTFIDKLTRTSIFRSQVQSLVDVYNAAEVRLNYDDTISRMYYSLRRIFNVRNLCGYVSQLR